MSVASSPIGKRRAEVAVVGAGIAGISTALFLEKAGFQVTVIEKGKVSGGATGSSSGVLYPGSGTYFQQAVDSLGLQDAKILFAQTKQSIDSLCNIAKGIGGSQLSSPGMILLAADQKELEFLAAEHKAMELLGLPGKILDSSEVAAHLSSVPFAGGLEQPLCSKLSPPALVRGIASSLESEVFEDAPLLGLETLPEGGLRLKTREGFLQAQQVVFATNLEPCFGLEKFFFSEGSVDIPSLPLGDSLKGFWHKEKIFQTLGDRYDLFYSHGGKVYFEAYEMKGIAQKAAKYFPGVQFDKSQAYGDSWAKTKDWLPIVGAVQPGVYCQVAMGDQGIVMGHATGACMPALLKGEKNAFLEMCSPQRFS